MKKNYIARRRGTSVAAAVLSLALVAPAVQTVAAPQVGPAAFAQTSGTVAATPATDPSKLIEADGIANGYVDSRIDMTNAFATLSGLVGLKETAASTSLRGTMGINDATVYMQFKDVDGTISPIYTAKSHQLGNTAGNYACQRSLKSSPKRSPKSSPSEKDWMAICFPTRTALCRVVSIPSSTLTVNLTSSALSAVRSTVFGLIRR